MSVMIRFGGCSLAGPSSPLIFNRRYLLRRKVPDPQKPPILPPSKSKLYRVPQYRWINPGDVADLLWRRHAYNNAILSMRKLFREETEQKKSFGVGIDRVKKDEREELEGRLEINDQRNRQYAEERAEREKLIMQDIEEETLKEIECRLNWDVENVERRTKEVEDCIERSKTEFITRENLEQKILKALENPITLDFAIDLYGTQIPNPTPAKYLIEPGSPERLYDRDPGFELIQTTQPPISGYTYRNHGRRDQRQQERNQAETIQRRGNN